MKKKYIVIFLIILSLNWTCSKSVEQKTIDRVVIVVIDGPRNIDLHADSLIEYNSGFQKIKEQGIYFGQMYNAGTTNTQNGMSNIITGVEESLINNGSEISNYPNIFHHYLESSQISSDKSWIITSKDKLESLKNTSDINYINAKTAKTNSGINGLNSSYREDSITYNIALDVLKNYQPNLSFICFREPDLSGHQANWEKYKLGIKSSLKYTQDLIDFINKDQYYSGRTLILITNDHGRHLNGIADGFVSHGDGCEGCRHITMVAISPNIITNTIDNSYTTQSNIAPTISKILNFTMPNAKANSISSIY